MPRNAWLQIEAGAPATSFTPIVWRLSDAVPLGALTGPVRHRFCGEPYGFPSCIPWMSSFGVTKCYKLGTGSVAMKCHEELQPSNGLRVPSVCKSSSLFPHWHHIHVNQGYMYGSTPPVEFPSF